MSELETPPPQAENQPLLDETSVAKLEEIRSKLVSQLALQETALETERLTNKKLQELIESLTSEKDELTIEKEDITKQMEEKVRLTDETISSLLAQLQEGQEKYDNLEKGKCLYCPWTWIRTITKDQYWVYRLVGLLAIIGGSKVLGR